MEGADRSFASVDDLKALYPSITDEERERADKLLALISSTIRQQCDWQHVEPDALKLVCCQVASRVMQVGAQTPIGAKTEYWQAAPFAGSISYANPTGDIYFTKFEKSLLGIGGARVYVVNQSIEGGSHA